MPANKYALLRYRIIDKCIRNKFQPYPSKEDLRLACEEALYNSNHERVSESTIEKDIYAMRNEEGLAVIDLPGAILKPKKLVLSAGAGNEGLLQALGETAPKMQRRPLQQVLVKHEYPHPLYAHCTGTNPSPRLTVSSHHCSDGWDAV